VSSGTDWVTLEGFAAGDLEREFSGVGEDSFRMLDNTWQYIMQGSAAPPSAEISTTDQYFVLYTQVRYLLDDVYERGKGLFPPLIANAHDMATPVPGACTSRRSSAAARRRSQTYRRGGVRPRSPAARATNDSQKLMVQLGTQLEHPGSNPLIDSLRAWDETRPRAESPTYPPRNGSPLRETARA